MSNSNMNSEIEARESAGLQAGAGSALPKGCSRAFNKGALPCKTAPHTYNNGSIITPLRQAIDSLYLTFRGKIFPEVDEQLNDLKLIAGNKTSLHSSKAVFRVLNHCFEVRPSGTKNFAYVLQDNWFYIKISSAKATTLPLASVQISSELLTHQPLEKILDDLQKTISTIGKITGEEQSC
ncbi:hypothetical protein QCB44_06335 [Thiomicrorhabdus sp. zzn3]|uniref:hypothetical protein n=1 Tax=Thiomicrorhabdus sp. zzn3 TaxID=3039775 RepID=UPI0024368128|nr:hypothetical protein [Thiomicrorhabdus sp. zzn3]MDG6778316.1 hypothetical protein [Thiomicrorhabdus sp. zzn3]